MRVAYLRKILILPNPAKAMALQLTVNLVHSLQQRGFEPVLAKQIFVEIHCATVKLDLPEVWAELDLVIVLGGDGSMLSAARQIYPHQIPLLGINLGHLGFLTRIESHRIEQALDDLCEGNYQLEDRSMLKAEVIRRGSSYQKVFGLNDLVVAKGAATRLIRLETWIDDEYFTTYPADGLIVATATGSTAYSLSAGGPILDPRLGAMIVTPICAHSLYARPLVLSEAARFKVILEAIHTDISLTADGQTVISLEPGDEILFSRAESTTRLLKFNRQGLFEVLKSRLKEGRI
jgi:NAD+ kinase